jgi:glutamate/tyrosine decarboxylase-like PLP-dependent enzyme
MFLSWMFGQVSFKLAQGLIAAGLRLSTEIVDDLNLAAVLFERLCVRSVASSAETVEGGLGVKNEGGSVAVIRAPASARRRRCS